ncbi:MAG TPA: heme lyase CcmF/NrfE family subunit [Gammaproteobacteria bacterium]|nr:heme lyase CcmF/NrfE family subunit [Gammaproteobacteria bacterium]
MIPEFGHFALILALCLAVSQSLIPLIGASFRKPAWMQLARPLAYGQCLFVAFAFSALAYSFVSNDFSVAYVASNSNSQLPWIYRICAVWGAHEGSLLLWVFLLSGWMSAVAVFSRSLPLITRARVLAVLGMISTGFLLFLLLTSNPFLRLLPNVPADGQDLNPLLQDPGLVIHPPMLYMGYVGFAVAFAFAIAALMNGRLDAAWACWSKPWTLVAWCFLTFGIILGSWWAYRELGWGGWWFWDPVENASFLPWLAGTALIHSLSVTGARDAFKAWTALLAICTFSLSLLGTFLVRSGVLISVHAFAVDPLRGVFMLVFLGLVIGAALLLYAFRAHTVRRDIRFNLYSRESMLLANNLLLTMAMLTILLGTLYPLIVDGLNLEKISVGPPYFNLVFVPFMVCVLVFMGLAPLSRWANTDARTVMRKMWLVLVMAVGLACLLPWVVVGRLNLGVVVGLGLALWVIIATLQHVLVRRGRFIGLKRLSRSGWGMVVAHVGVAVCVCGVVLTTHYSEEQQVRMNPGDSVSLGSYVVRFLGVRDLQGANYSGVAGGVIVSRSGRAVAFLQPEQRVYSVQKTALAKTAIDVGLFRDVYVALGEPLDHQAWSLRVYYKPFVRWIWGGGLMIILGGILALMDRRYRVRV